MAVKPIVAHKMALDMQNAVLATIHEGSKKNIEHLVIIAYLTAMVLEYDDTLNEEFVKKMRTCYGPAQDIFFTLQKRFESNFVIKNPIDSSIVDKLIAKYRLP